MMYPVQLEASTETIARKPSGLAKAHEGIQIPFF